MFQRNRRGFRGRPNGRGHSSKENGYRQARPRSNSFSNNQPRNNFRPMLSAEKSFEKYTSLAKEAVSSGDITLSENYLQHADHYSRRLAELNERSRINSNGDTNNNSVDTSVKDESKS